MQDNETLDQVRENNSINLWHSVKDGDGDRVKKLLQENVNINYIYKYGSNQRKKTPLMVAANRGNLKALNLLLDAGANVNIQSDTFNALFLVRHNLLKSSLVLEELLKYKANVNYINKADMSVLHYYVKYPFEFVKALLDGGAYPNYQNKRGQTPLIIAVKWLNVAGVKILLESGANINTRNNKGLMALDIAKEMLKETKNPEKIAKCRQCIELINNEIKYRKELTKIFDTNPLSTVSNIILSKLYYPESINYDEKSQNTKLAIDSSVKVKT